MTDESLLTATLLELADTLVGDFDLTDLFVRLVDHCVTVVGVSAAGLMLVSPGGDLRMAASSSHEMQVVELFEIQSQEGPCLDSYHSGDQVVNVDLATARARWPRFAPLAIEAGFCSVHALPMKLRDSVLGAINLFNDYPGELAASDLAAGKALADMATIAILQHRAAIHAKVINENLQNALNDRLVIEQAKGVLAERAGLQIEEAFVTMRNHARNHNLRLVDVARQVIEGGLDAASLDRPRSS